MTTTKGPGGVSTVRPPRGYWITLLVLLCSFVAVRLLVICSYWPGHGDSSELYLGTIAREYSQGAILQKLKYQIQSTGEGGSVILGWLGALAFTFIGRSYAVLKLMALVCVLSSTLLWVVLCKRVFGSRVALWYLAAAVLIPPDLLYWSLWLNGNWSLIDMVHAIGLLLLVRLIERRHAIPKSAKATKGDLLIMAVLGFIVGVGIYISNYLYIFALYALVAVFLFCRYASFHGFAMFSLGILLGMLPWIAYNATHSFAALQIFKFTAPGGKTFFCAGRSIGDWLLSNFLNTLYQMSLMILYWLPCSWVGSLMRPGLLRILLGRGYELLILLGVVIFLAERRAVSQASRAKAPNIFPMYARSEIDAGSVIFGFFGLAILATCASRMGIVREDYYAYRYLIPLQPLYLISLAVFFDRMTLSPMRLLRMSGWSMACVLAAALSIAIFSAAPRCNPGALTGTLGYCYGSLGVRMAQQGYYEGRPDGMLALAEKVKDRQDRDDLMNYLADMYWFIPIAEKWGPVVALRGSGHFEVGDVEGFKKFAEEKIDERYRPLLYRALGRGIAWTHGPCAPKVAGLIGTLDAPSARWAWQGFGSIEAWRYGAESSWLPATLNDAPGSARRPFCEGVGAVWGFFEREGMGAFEPLLRDASADVRRDCMAGIEMGFCRNPFERLEI